MDYLILIKSLHLQFAFETAAVHEFAFINESDEGI